MTTSTPCARDLAVTRRFQAQRRRDTAPEIALRRALHALGLRFFVDRAPLPSAPRRRADVVFPRLRVAVFVHGCFWHGCPEHGTWPTNNADWWRAKIERTRRRDRQTARRLREHGWAVVEVWEHTRTRPLPHAESRGSSPPAATPCSVPRRSARTAMAS